MAATFSSAHIGQYLKYIGLPDEDQHATPSISLLKKLHMHTISACPYENLSIHYNPTHNIILDPQHLFQKVVLDARGRGGYCMELAILFNHVLRSMGFDAYTVGARTRKRRDGVPHGDYPGWVHIVNIVTFHGVDGGPPERYRVDVAFGGDGPVGPLPLIPDLAHRNLGSQEVRLVRDWIPAQLHRVEQSKLWIYQYRNSSEAEWNSFYVFADCEFMAPDWEVVNAWALTSRHSWQTSTVLVVKFLRRAVSAASCEQEQDQEQEIYGKRMLAGDVVKENLGGKTRVIKVCHTEAERIEALREDFAIHLTAEEVDAIKGRPVDLDGGKLVATGVENGKLEVAAGVRS